MQPSYNWTNLAKASEHTRTGKYLKAMYKALLKPSSNNQLKSKTFHLRCLADSENAVGRNII